MLHERDSLLANPKFVNCMLKIEEPAYSL